MNTKYLKYLVLTVFCLSLAYNQANAQNKNQQEQSKSLTVNDQNGSPIVGASIFTDEGNLVFYTDASGKADITMKGSKPIRIEAAGYDTKIVTAAEYKANAVISLSPENFSNGMAEIAFDRIPQIDITDATTIVRGEDLLKYDLSLKLDQALIGMIPSIYTMRYGTLVEFNKGPIALRSYGESLGALAVVDGMPRTWETISLSEVDQISILKDVHASVLYGTDAANGVVMITTKRGQAFKKDINIWAYYGFETPKALPKYLNSADYMMMYDNARTQDGMPVRYGDEEIAKYRIGNPVRYPSIDFYSKDNLRAIAPMANIIAEFSGGSDKAQYYTNLAWEHSSDLVNVGSATKQANNAFRVRGNVDLKLNNWISTDIDAFARFENNAYDTFDRTFIGYYWNQADNLLPNAYAPLIPIDMVDPADPELLAATNIIDGKYLLGGNAQNLTGPFARLYSGGDIAIVQRWFQFSNRIDFDLNWLLKGLSFHTNLSFDFWTNYQQATPNTYAIYYAESWSATDENLISKLHREGNDTRPGTQNVSDGFFERRFGFTAQLNYDRTFDENRLSASLFGYGTLRRQTNQLQGDKNAHLGLRAAYSLKNKYVIDFNGALVNSVKLPENHRVGFSPTLGLGWIISNEDFLADNNAINFLKIRLSGGILNTDYDYRSNWYEGGSSGFFWYENVYGTSGSYTWNDGTSASGVITSYGANNNLTYSKIKEIALGVDTRLFNALDLTADVYFRRYADQIIRMSNFYASFYGNYAPYGNNDEDAYRGFEMNATYNKKIGDFSFMFNANMLYSTSKIITRSEIRAYDYLKRPGNTTDAMWALQADGFFKDQADIDASPKQTFGTYRPGDIKYVDTNKDGLIDNDDQVKVGRSRSPIALGARVLVGYKGFTLLVTGWGRFGADTYIPNNGYYRPSSSNKYSEYIMGKTWTPETSATATLPRMTTGDAANNNQNSTFYLYRNNYAYIDKVQLTYNFPQSFTRKLRMKDLSVYLRGSELLTVSKHKDIIDLNIGGRPDMRSFLLGVKFGF